MSDLSNHDEYHLMRDSASSVSIWLSDVKHESAFHIDGFDKSLQQCPPPSMCPENCSIRYLDILQPLPPDLEGIYDIVHVRLIQRGLKDDPAPALKNLITMLKPRGYLQWQEIGLSSLSVTSANLGLDQSGMEELTDELHDFGQGQRTPRLADICTENGLLEAKTDNYRVPPEIAIPFCQTQLLAYTEISRVAMDNKTPDAKGPRFRKLIERAHGELQSGVWLDHKLEVTVARKAE